MNQLKTITFTLILLILTIGNSWAENKNIIFGKVTIDELKMKVYEQDTSAVAVILYDSGASYFETEYLNDNSNFICKFERHVRIKILKQEGFDFATFKIPLYHSNDGNEKMVTMKAKTYNLDRKIVEDKLEKNSIFNEETSPNWRRIKFTMPNIKVGSVIEIKYQISSPFYRNFRAWQFQYSIPVIYSQYNTRIPSYFNYQKTTKGYYPITKMDEGARIERFLIKYQELDREYGNSKKTEYEYTLMPTSQAIEYSAKNIPAFKTESYMLAEKNYMSAIEFELQSYQFPNSAIHEFTNTWNRVQQELIHTEHFGLALKKDEFIKDVLSNIIKDVQSEEEKTALIFETVQNTIKWNERSRLFCENSLKKIWKDKSGNTAEINLLLVAMLRKAGIEANPVVLSTRQNGIIHPSHPTLTQMNYVIACASIKGENYLMDATDPYCPIGMLPFRCLNDKGRLITKNKSEWIDLTPNKGAKTVIMSNLTLTEKGTLKGNVTEAFYNYKGVNMRKKILKNTEAYSEKLESDYEDWNISEIKYKNLNDRTKLLQIRYLAEIVNHSNMKGERIYLNPILKYKTDDNPFKLEQREYPVNFGYPIQVNYTMNLELPTNFTIEEIPKSQLITLPENGGAYTYNIGQIANKITIQCKFNINKSQYLPTEYEYLKEFYNQVIGKENRFLVLKKVEPTTEK